MQERSTCTDKPVLKRSFTTDPQGFATIRRIESRFCVIPHLRATQEAEKIWFAFLKYPLSSFDWILNRVFRLKTLKVIKILSKVIFVNVAIWENLLLPNLNRGLYSFDARIYRRQYSEHKRFLEERYNITAIEKTLQRCANKFQLSAQVFATESHKKQQHTKNI